MEKYVLLGFAIVSLIFGVLRFILPSTGHINHDHLLLDIGCLVLGGLVSWTIGTSHAPGPRSLPVTSWTLWTFGIALFLPTVEWDGEIVFKCLAHLFIGASFQYWYIGLIDPKWFIRNPWKSLGMLVAILLTIAEVVAFKLSQD